MSVGTEVQLNKSLSSDIRKNVWYPINNPLWIKCPKQKPEKNIYLMVICSYGLNFVPYGTPFFSSIYSPTAPILRKKFDECLSLLKQ